MTPTCTVYYNIYSGSIAYYGPALTLHVVLISYLKQWPSEADPATACMDKFDWAIL
jgi:hypothetical protein